MHMCYWHAPKIDLVNYQTNQLACLVVHSLVFLYQNSSDFRLYNLSKNQLIIQILGLNRLH
jgi:hypothetical protein